MSKFDAFEHLHIQIDSDGSVTRLLQSPQVQATGEDGSAQMPIASKDIDLDPKKKTKIRIYRPTKLPSNDNSVARLPIILYFHGGGWIHNNISDVVVDARCAQVTTDVPAIVVSVGYRLAPEHRLPAPYDDAIDAIKWVNQQMLDDANGEKWLVEYADANRCYLFGCSNGGNIVFHTALKILDMDSKPLTIAGLIMNQPMFGGNKRTKTEIKLAADELLPLPAIDAMWDLALPKGTDRDHRYCNPMADGPHKAKIRSLGRCLVLGYGGDPMVDRQQSFVKMLVDCGVRVEAAFDDVGFHGIDLVDPRRASVAIHLVKDFIC
ncbi:Alpha/beta hydrolase fold-3 [Dillenia turbinata]|uniref:Alpha/beta hydrolase fold-3 n=1 Tax=Dillenia turbinata TaxID=194707 RepID=A0AAN8UY93_9MAGN